MTSKTAKGGIGCWRQCGSMRGIGCWKRDSGASLAHYEESLTICGEIGNKLGIALSLDGLGIARRAWRSTGR
jgi:hypothetical protein